MSDFKQMLKDREPKLLDRKDGHYYENREGKTYPSISTILSATMRQTKKDGLAYWKKSEPAHEYITKQAQEIGTETHKMIEDFLKLGFMNENFDTSDYNLIPKAHFDNLTEYLLDIKDVVGIEQKMYSNKYKVSGMSDCIAYYKGVLSIIDYKTKRKHQINSYLTDYYIQTTCYAQMFEEVTGQKIEQIVILVSTEKNERQEFIKQCSDYTGLLEERVNEYYKNL